MNKKSINIIIILISLLLVTCYLSLFFGTQYIAPKEVFSNAINQQIVLNIRLPRTIAAILTGMTLAMSGYLIQAALQNQLADANILGFQSGATLFAMFVILVNPLLYPLLPLLSFSGGLIVFLIVFTVAKKTNGSVYIIVAGIAINAVVRSFINFLSLIYADELENTMSWLNGSLNGVTTMDALYMLIYSVILTIIVIIFTTKIDLNILDDLYLLNLGLNPIVIRLLTTTLAILLSSISVSFVGTIGFVGLLAPHIARRLVTNTAVNMLPVVMLIGSMLVLFSDTLQRIIIPIYEIPVGIIMSLIGGVFLITLLLRSYDA